MIYGQFARNYYTDRGVYRALNEGDYVIQSLYDQYKDYKSMYMNESCNYLTETEEAVLEAKMQVITESITVGIIAAIIAIAGAIITLIGLLIKLLSKGSSSISSSASSSSNNGSKNTSSSSNNKSRPTYDQIPKLSIDEKKKIIYDMLGDDCKIKGWSDIDIEGILKCDEIIKVNNKLIELYNESLKHDGIDENTFNTFFNIISIVADKNKTDFNSEDIEKAFFKMFWNLDDNVIDVFKDPELFKNSIYEEYNESATPWENVIDHIADISKDAKKIFDSSTETLEKLEESINKLNSILNKLKNKMQNDRDGVRAQVAYNDKKFGNYLKTEKK